MKDIEFNLLDEKWILVRKSDCTVDELSLTDALLKSHEYVELAGELPTQNVSILRLMLAVLHTVFSRYSPQGEPAPLYDSDDAADRWKELWNAGRLPEKPIKEYLASVHDRFWLFHPDRPFYQTMKVNTEETAAVFKAFKLNGAVSESDHKLRWFAARSGDDKERLTYPEAARWLLHINSFDDKSNERGKDKDKKIKASSGADYKGSVGWLGKLGIITAHGKNVFEDLLLNFLIFDNDADSVWGDEKPIWEDEVHSNPRVKIVQPNNLAELYTLQSRRIALHRENGYVTECKICNGDYFPEEDAFIEPMTVWNGQKAKNGTMHYNPKVHDNTAQMWREFSSCFYVEKGKEGRRPGVVQWVDYLRGHCFIDRTRTISFETCSAKYDANKAMYKDIFSDSLTMHTDLITEIGEHWRAIIGDEIKKCERVFDALQILAVKIALAAGRRVNDTAKLLSEVTELEGDISKSKKTNNKETAKKEADEEKIQKTRNNIRERKFAAVERAREQYYYEIDLPFRNWLEGIDPNWGTDSEQKYRAIEEWHETAKRIALRIGQELVESAGTAAIVGRTIEIEKKKGNKITVHYSAPDAYRYFKVKLNKFYPKEENND